MESTKVFNPMYWHAHTMDKIHQLSDSKQSWILRNPKLMGTNALAIGTGAAALLSELAKLILLQPAGLAVKGGIGVAQAVTRWHFAEGAMNHLPQLGDLLKTAKKVALLTGGLVLSSGATVVSLATPKLARFNTNFQRELYLESQEKPAEQKSVEEPKKEHNFIVKLIEKARYYKEEAQQAAASLVNLASVFSKKELLEFAVLAQEKAARAKEILSDLEVLSQLDPDFDRTPLTEIGAIVEVAQQAADQAIQLCQSEEAAVQAELDEIRQMVVETKDSALHLTGLALRARDQAKQVADLAILSAYHADLGELESYALQAKNMAIEAAVQSRKVEPLVSGMKRAQKIVQTQVQKGQANADLLIAIDATVSRFFQACTAGKRAAVEARDASFQVRKLIEAKRVTEESRIQEKNVLAKEKRALADEKRAWNADSVRQALTQERKALEEEKRRMELEAEQKKYIKADADDTQQTEMKRLHHAHMGKAIVRELRSRFKTNKENSLKSSQ